VAAAGCYVCSLGAVISFSEVLRPSDLSMPIKLMLLLLWRIVLLLVGVVLVVPCVPLLLLVGVNLPDPRFGLFFVAIAMGFRGEFNDARRWRPDLHRNCSCRLARQLAFFELA